MPKAGKRHIASIASITVNGAALITPMRCHLARIGEHFTYDDGAPDSGPPLAGLAYYRCIHGCYFAATFIGLQIIIANLRSLVTITPHAKCGRVIGMTHKSLVYYQYGEAFLWPETKKKRFLFLFVARVGGLCRITSHQ